MIWEGDRTAVGKFAFGDTEIQIINVQEQDAFGDPILYTTGSDKTDLMFGDQYANIIDGGGGDDVAYEEIAAMAEMLAELSAEEDPNIDISQKVDSTLDEFSVDVGNDSNDTILGGDGIDDIDSGDGENFVSSGRLELEIEGETDLETLREHIKSHKDIFDDDDWI